MTGPSNRLESIFASAVGLPMSERDAFLAERCDGDPSLLLQVEALLRAHDRSRHLLARPVAVAPEGTAVYVQVEMVGAVIAGRYKLLEEIGVGGMGSVWVAEQTQPMRRKVAVKLIKAGMDSRPILARFEAERQALALMDHPNIAKVLDGGLTELGRPFIVMEYVKGVPITEYCDSMRLSVPQRLDLFCQVCLAVQHAHQKGVIHRDLKPSNILVAPYDDSPAPKVIDFGLAKAANQSLTEHTLHTAHETVLGTPLYMSPEQAQFNNLDIDTRTDVYSLGVLLYELLTGGTPLEKERFKEAAWEEVQRFILEEDPPRPSTRLSSDKTLPSLAANRRVDAAGLQRLVRGELDWIVMKCLEKDRSRRYETAGGLARDVQRYVAGDAVEACPPTLGYRLRKTFRKHRGAILTAAAFATVLLIATGVSVVLGLKARQAELQAKQEAEAAGFLLDTFLGQDEGIEASAGNVSFKVVLDRAVRELDRGAKRDPLAVARIRGRLGRTYLMFGQSKEATNQLERAQEILERELGPDDLETLNNQEALAYAVGSLSERGDRLLQDVLERRRAVQGRDHMDVIRTTRAMGQRLSSQGKTKEAEGCYRQALELAVRSQGDDSKEAIGCKMLLASHLARRGAEDESIRLTREAVESANRVFADDDPFLLMVKRHDIAYGSRRSGTPSDHRRRAEALLPLLPEFVKAYGPDHPTTLMVMDDLALHCVWGEMDEEADPISQEYLEKRIRVHGADSAAANRARWLRGEALLGLGRIDEARAVLGESIERARRNNWRAGHEQVALGECLLKEHQYRAAEEQLVQGYEQVRDDPSGEETAVDRRRIVEGALRNLIAVSTALDRPDDVRRWQKELAELP